MAAQTALLHSAGAFLPSEHAVEVSKLSPCRFLSSHTASSHHSLNEHSFSISCTARKQLRQLHPGQRRLSCPPADAGNRVAGAGKKAPQRAQAQPVRKGSVIVDTFQKPGAKVGRGRRPAPQLERQESSNGRNLSRSQSGRIRSHQFHVDGGGQVRTYVDVAGGTCTISIVVDTKDMGVSNEVPLHLHWGLSRSDRDQWVLIDPATAPAGTYVLGGELEALRTPLVMKGGNVQELKISLDASKVPFALNFVLYQPATAMSPERWLRSTSQSNFCIPVGLQRGRPEPLGATLSEDGSVNFALYTKSAEGVVLCLYARGAKEPSMEIDLNPASHKTGHVWHVQVDNPSMFDRYGYRCKGEASWEWGNRFHARAVVLDPYARVLAPFVPGQEDLPSPALALGLLPRQEAPFDWEEDFPPGIPQEETVAYRMNVAAFTADRSSGLDEGSRGTFLGVAANVDHLVALGVNAVILQPVAAFDETLGSYFPVSFFAPAAAYGPGGSGRAACSAFKEMVKTLHEKGIEVIIDVVFSHTAEGDDLDPKVISFRGIDNATYYLCDEFGKLRQPEFGVGNAFNCNHPTVIRMLVDSLHWWVEEYHVDGFCFINAQALVTGPHGQQLSRPPLVEAISFDSVLGGVKLIADTQSPVNGIVQKLAFPHWGRWAEWNVKFRNDVRRFTRGEMGALSGLATRLCGSADLFQELRGPNLGLNHVTSPYGYSLADLVSYSVPSEDQRVVDELSWNCGEEGPMANEWVMLTRTRQVRNFLLTLMLSQGVPVLTMGDEYGHSKSGQIDIEDRKGRFRWGLLGKDYGQKLAAFIAQLVVFRQVRSELFQRKDFEIARHLEWHGRWANSPEWDNPSSCVLAATLHAPPPEEPALLAEPAAATSAPPSRLPPVRAEGDLYIAFNSHNYNVSFSLPEPAAGTGWFRLVDTNLPFEEDFLEEPTLIAGTGFGESPHGAYDLSAYSILLLEARQLPVVVGGSPIGARY